MDEKGFLLGMSDLAKVIVRRGRLPRETENGSRECITAVETCCANNAMLPPMDIYHGKGLYRGWFGADDDYADQTAPNRSKQPGGNLAYTLSTTDASYSHCFELRQTKSDGRHAWSLQGSTNTPSKFLAWKAPPTTPPVECCNSHSFQFWRSGVGQHDSSHSHAFSTNRGCNSKSRDC